MTQGRPQPEWFLEDLSSRDRDTLRFGQPGRLNGFRGCGKTEFFQGGGLQAIHKLLRSECGFSR